MAYLAGYATGYNDFGIFNLPKPPAGGPAKDIYAVRKVIAVPTPQELRDASNDRG